MSLSQIFSDIYQKNEWTYGSGPGSQPQNINPYMDYLTKFIQMENVRTILDIGCGNWAFMRMIDLSGIEYLGMDIVKDVILTNRAGFGSKSVSFILADATTYIPEKKYDVIILKDVLQHLSYESCFKTLTNLKGFSKALMITNDAAIENRDCPDGGWRPLNMKMKPFNLLIESDLIFKSVPFPKHTTVIKRF